MYDILLKSHSGFRWLVLLVMVIGLFKSLASLKKDYGKFDNVLRILALIFNHVQLIVGLALYFISPVIKSFWTRGTFEGDELTFFGVYHIVMMLASVVLITIGSTKIKKGENGPTKHKRTLLYFGVSLALIIASIPWFRPMG